MRNRISGALGSFTLVGALGFLIDASLLTGLTHICGWSPWQARAVSFPTALLTTWSMNRRLTFRGRAPRRLSVEVSLYGAIQLCGAGINLIVFGLCLSNFPQMKAYPAVPFAIGAAVALVFNFSALNKLVYYHLRNDIDKHDLK